MEGTHRRSEIFHRCLVCVILFQARGKERNTCEIEDRCYHRSRRARKRKKRESILPGNQEKFVPILCVDVVLYLDILSPQQEEQLELIARAINFRIFWKALFSPCLPPDLVPAPGVGVAQAEEISEQIFDHSAARHWGSAALCLLLVPPVSKVGTLIFHTFALVCFKALSFLFHTASKPDGILPMIRCIL